MSVAPLEAVAVAGDDPVLVAALIAAGLPTDDLTDPGRRFLAFRAPADAGLPIGHGGWERLSDESALLRSLVVDPAARRRGRGGAILERLMEAASPHGFRWAWLITTDRADWFGRSGFVVVPREATPPEVRACRQFAGLCPASAVVMRRDLAP